MITPAGAGVLATLVPVVLLVVVVEARIGLSAVDRPKKRTPLVVGLVVIQGMGLIVGVALLPALARLAAGEETLTSEEASPLWIALGLVWLSLVVSLNDIFTVHVFRMRQRR